MQQQTQIDIANLIGDTLAGLNLIQSQPSKQSASVWVLVFSQLLQCLRWPGERSESSHEYQAKQAWGKVLQQFSALDFLGEQFSASSASTLLQKIAKEQVFQPETTGQSIIQILGIMEALSAPVEAMWCMGMNDDRWPLPARPNPLLPANIQRAAKVANADSAIQADFAQIIHQRLLNSAKQIIFSSSLNDGDKILRASPLMQNIPISTQTMPIAKTFAEHQAALGNTDITMLDDHIAPVVGDGVHVRGGTGLLRAQAICPAWAFYQFRLGAKSLRSPKNGLDASERGQLVHAVLEAFWQSRHWADLRDIGDDALRLAVFEAAKTAILQFTQHQDEVFSGAILELEHERLCKLVLAWLDFEKSREMAFHIIACEVEKKVNIGGVEVTLKIDRIHRLENGGLELVDYKTGRLPSIKSWGEDRITEPQLPIYALFYDEEQNVVSIQFGLVKTAEHSFTGLSEANFEIDTDKRKPDFIRGFVDWQHLKKHWNKCIGAIVQEIKSGEAAVIFENEANLLYCEVLPLLRVPERQLQFERQLLEDTQSVEASHD
jgi:exodeoxyribonuclease-5